MTLNLWEEQQNFNNAYTETDRINRLVNNFMSDGKTMTGAYVNDRDFRRNDSINPFATRSTTSDNFSNTSKKTDKKPSKLKTIKTVLTIGGIVGGCYLGYKYIYKPLKKEYDTLMDRIVVKCDSEKPLNGQIRPLTPLEMMAYDHKYGSNLTVLDSSQYEIHDEIKED